jgi:thiol-disulfide isomerase/thioredoxin
MFTSSLSLLSKYFDLACHQAMISRLSRVCLLILVSFICLGLTNKSYAELSTSMILAKMKAIQHAENNNEKRQNKEQKEVLENQGLSNLATDNDTKANTATTINTPSTAPKANTLIGQLAQQGYALMFFFDSQCPHCENFAPVVKGVASEYGFNTFAFTFDQKGLPSFPYPAPVTKTIYHAYYGNVRPFYPVLVLQNVNTMAFYIISKGETSKPLLEQTLQRYAKELLA